jgi:hypothetical protein
MFAHSDSVCRIVGRAVTLDEAPHGTLAQSALNLEADTSAVTEPGVTHRILNNLSATNQPKKIQNLRIKIRNDSTSNG